MAHKEDWIPKAQDRFVDFSQQYVAALNEHGPDLNLAAALITTVSTKQTAFMAGWNTLQTGGKSTPNSAAKKTLVDGHRTWIRDFHNENIRYNHALTDELRALLGIPIPDHTHTHITVGNRKVGFELESVGTFLVNLKCWDEETGEKKILYGMSGIVAVYHIGDEPTTDIASFTESALLTKTTHTFRGATGQRGKWISVTVCWQSETGERGPWAAPRSAVIP